MPAPTDDSPPPEPDASEPGASESGASESGAVPSGAAETDAAETDASPTRSRAAWILKAGAIVFAVLGTAMAGWMADKWIRYPQMQASQFDFSAPLWPAATLFVLVATGAGVALLWKAARRSEAGEDLFAQRHRHSLKEVRRRRRSANEEGGEADSSSNP